MTNAAIAPYVRPGQGLYFRAPYGVWRKVHADFLNQDPELKHYVGPVYWDIGGDISYDDDGGLRAAADWDCWSQDLTADQCAQGYMRESAAQRFYRDCKVLELGEGTSEIQRETIFRHIGN